jgi:hypothetical protein
VLRQTMLLTSGRIPADAIDVTFSDLLGGR